MKIRKKKYLDTDVYTEAKRRINYCYDAYDDVAVSFSGGKDSTALLLVTLEVAEARGRLPLKVIHYDEEVIHPETVAYVKRVREREDVDLEWYCTPFKHRNACSSSSPYWFSWDPSCPELWVHDKPDFAISEHPKWYLGISLQEFGRQHFAGTHTIVLQGIRTEESLRRYRSVAMKKNDNFISTPKPGVNFGYPIYDWDSVDVWKIVALKDEDYNRSYDILDLTKKHESYLEQRVCTPYGEAPLHSLNEYAECWPEFWEKMMKRVPGAATAAKYCESQLYGRVALPDGVNWREHISNMLDSYDPKYRKSIRKQINDAIKVHNKKTRDPVPEDQPHPISGCSYKFLAKMASKGDHGGRMSQAMQQEAQVARNRLGITEEEAQREYGGVR